jgi:hypothetical protein
MNMKLKMAAKRMLEAIRPNPDFVEGFMDGFTMAGFLTWLERPGAPIYICKPEPDEDCAEG